MSSLVYISKDSFAKSFTNLIANKTEIYSKL